LLAAGWRDEEIIARHPALQPHHVESVRSRFGEPQEPESRDHMRIRRRDKRDSDDG
jgi:hypothetical protein